MKVVINTCYGGFSLSPKAVHWIAAKNKRPCYFFETQFKNSNIEYVPIEGYPTGMFWAAADVKEILSDTDYSAHTYDQRPENRSDPLLVQVVEELGAEANGACAELKIVDIPDGVDYVIREYDGMEHIAEAHRTWS